MQQGASSSVKSWHHLQPPRVKIGIDIAGMFANVLQHQHYIVTVVDYASIFPECMLTSDIHSVKIIDWLKQRSIFTLWEPQPIGVQYNGLQFTSAKFAKFLKSHMESNISSWLSTIYQRMDSWRSSIGF